MLLLYQHEDMIGIRRFVELYETIDFELVILSLLLAKSLS